MEILAAKNLTFRYPESERDVLNNISFSLDAGEFVTLCGASGCGKSTLLKQFKSVLSPKGSGSGDIFFSGKPLNETDHREQSSRIGFIGQSPDNQTVTDKVWHELAFGLESLGLDNSLIRGRTAEIASYFGIDDWFDKNVNELSGGQKQILNLASVMVMRPEILLLDEPTSQLDPIAAGEFLSILGRINRDLGITVLITEHRLEEVFFYSGRILVMDRGNIIADGGIKETGLKLREHGHKMFLSMPAPMKVWVSVPDGGDSCPVSIKDGRKWLREYGDRHSFNKLSDEIIPEHGKEPSVRIDNIYYRYEKNSPDILKGVSLKAYPGELLAVLGGNGTGKSTMLSVISGIRHPYRGNISLKGQKNDCINSVNKNKAAALPQNPQALFVKKTVLEDLYDVYSESDIPYTEQTDKIRSVMNLCGLEHIKDRHPYDLSGGEQQRTALAKVLLADPDILLLDEPTKGFDAEFKIQFAGILDTLLKRGATIIMVSHDVEFCAKYAHRCLLLFNGSVISENTPRKFFANNNFYTTSANRMARDIIPGAITENDIITACAGKIPPPPDTSEKYSGYDITCSDTQAGGKQNETDKRKSEEIQERKNEKKLNKRTVFSLLILLSVIPLTLFIGTHFFGNRKYLFTSLLIVIECIIPFFMIFEGRKPQARELVMIAVLCALGVAGRSVFYMFPQFKPVAALVIIAGVVFGGETGFITGSLTMLVSNILFHQGPWTPWQMFAMGIIGFLAGVLSKKGWLLRNRISLCLFGFLSVLILYGGIMNTASAIMAGPDLNVNILLTSFASGFPMDIVHAVAAFVFLFFLSDLIIGKLERVKVKYGLVI